MDETVNRQLADQTDYIALAQRQLEYGDPRSEASTYALIAVASELRRIADALADPPAAEVSGCSLPLSDV